MGFSQRFPAGSRRTAEPRRDLPRRSDGLSAAPKPPGLPRGAPRRHPAWEPVREGGRPGPAPSLPPARCRLGNKANGQKRLRHRKRPAARGGAEEEAVSAGGAGTPSAAVPWPRPRGSPRPRSPPLPQAPPLDRGRRRRGGCGGAAAEPLKERCSSDRARHCPAPPRPSPPPPPRGGPSRRVDAQRLAGTAGAGTHGRHGLLQLRRAGERPALPLRRRRAPAPPASQLRLGGPPPHALCPFPPVPLPSSPSPCPRPCPAPGPAVPAALPGAWGRPQLASFPPPPARPLSLGGSLYSCSAAPPGTSRCLVGLLPEAVDRDRHRDGSAPARP